MFIQIYRRSDKAQLLQAGLGPKRAGHALRNAEVIIYATTSSALPARITRNQAWKIEDLSNEALIAQCQGKPPKQGEYHAFGNICVVKTFSPQKDDPNGVYARYLGLLHSASGLFVTELRVMRAGSAEKVVALIMTSAFRSACPACLGPKPAWRSCALADLR